MQILTSSRFSGICEGDESGGRGPETPGMWDIFCSVNDKNLRVWNVYSFPCLHRWSLYPLFGTLVSQDLCLTPSETLLLH